MDKINELEKRIKNLENYVNFKRELSEDASKSAIIWQNVTSDNEGFEDNFINKYSVKEYRKKGFGKEFEQLDFKTVVEACKGNNVKKLNHWSDFQRKLINTLGLLEYRESEYWAELVWFTRNAIRYYQDAIIEWILKEGRHYEQGGRPADIYTEDVKETIIEFWESYKANPKYQHKNGRYKGKPQKQIIYSKIADKIGILSKPFDRESDRTKRIEQIIKEHTNRNNHPV